MKNMKKRIALLGVTGVVMAATAISAAAAQGQVKAAVTAGQAKEAALKQAGLSASQVTGLQVQLDYDDGRAEYEGEFYYNGLEYEFAVDAASGSVVEWDVESIYD